MRALNRFWQRPAMKFITGVPENEIADESAAG
jgi:hypothetical protein